MMAFDTFFSPAAFGAYLAIFTIFVVYLVRELSFRRPELIPGVPVIGLDSGKRTLKEARHLFMHHGGEMVKEGYEKVVST